MEKKFIQPAQLKYNVCKQCRKNAYINKNFSGWNEYVEAWWTPCLTDTPFSIGKTILRSGYICCPPKIFLDMKEEVVSIITKNFSGDKRKILIDNLTGCPSQRCYITNPIPDWCPNQELHKKRKIELLKIFGAVIINKEIRYAIVCHNCKNEWYIKEELPKSTSSAGGIFVKNSITTKDIVSCNRCKYAEKMTVLKRTFFYG